MKEKILLNIVCTLTMNNYVNLIKSKIIGIYEAIQLTVPLLFGLHEIKLGL